MAKICVLGAGLVGSLIAIDLAKESSFEVVSFDRQQSALAKVSERSAGRVAVQKADLRDAHVLHSSVENADLVICAVPGFMGYRTLETIIDSKKSFVDISFMPEDARGLDSKAKERDVIGIVDCGVAPGMSNILSAKAVSELDRAEDLKIYVGGLPIIRKMPHEYAAVFSPSDVIEEYTRPARFVEHGKEVVREALSDIEWLDFEGVGTLEAFNTDGLRSLAWSLNVPFMKEKTMRYPGHASRMKFLRDCGFFSTDMVSAGETQIRPVDLTCKLLSDGWRLRDGEGDLTVMRVEATGLKNGEKTAVRYDLLDRYDPEQKANSMSRTTGFPCAIVARMMLDKTIKLEKGVHFPERLASFSDVMERLFSELEKRGVRFPKSI